MEVRWLEQTLAEVRAEADWLSPHERERIAGMRIAKRRQDWRLGRWTAKNAVAAFLELPVNPSTLAAIEIRPADSGAPQVVFKNEPAAISISISHRDGCAACAIASAGTVLGCDLEVVEPRCDAFVTDYFTPEERELVTQTPEAERFRILALLWSAKESTLKALRSGLRLDTRCVAVELGVDSAAPFPLRESSLSGAWHPLRTRYLDEQVFHGWWQVSGEIVRTMVSAPAAGPPVRLELAAVGRAGL